MAIYQLATNQAATGVGAAGIVQPSRSKFYKRGVLHVQGITTATVVLQGSLDGTNFATIATRLADGVQDVPLPKFIRSNVTAYTAGTINVFVESER